MAEPLHPSSGRDRPGRHGPQRRQAVAAARQHGQADYPVARPYAPPPPTSPYYKPMPTAVVPAPLPPLPTVALEAAVPPARQGLSRYWIEGLVLAGVVWLCMTAGWFFFRGPGQRLFASRTETEKPTTVVADASKPDDPRGSRSGQPRPTTERPRDPQPSRPAPTPKPTPEKPAATTPVTPKQPPPTQERPKPPPTQDSPPQPPSSNNALTFEKHVLPIFQRNCIGCHGGGKRVSAKLDLRTVDAMLKGNSSGPSLVRRKPDQSPIWQTIQDGSMPKGPNKLTASEKRIVQQWIAEGARER